MNARTCRRLLGLLVASAALGGGTLAAQTAPNAATPATQPAAAAAPTTLPTFVVPEDLTGARLAFEAQVAFNRGEYAKALPMLRKMALEVADQPARLGAIQERMRVCEKALDALRADPNAAASAAKIDIPSAADRKPHAAPKAGEVYETTIQGLGNFDYDQEKGGNVPQDVQSLSGATVRIRGYMIPMDQADNITQFALVPSLFACCFGQPPTVQHTIVVNCPKGKAVSYCPDEIIVEGKLNVQEKKDDGYIVSLFEMEVSSVKVAPK